MSDMGLLKIKKNNNKKNNSGFTLLELLIVVAIMIIMLSVSLFNYNKFGKNIELENDAYTVALSIREAQVYGVNKASREKQEIEFGKNYRYGIYFARTSKGVTGVDDKKFIIYVDGLRDDSTIEPESQGERFTDLGSTNCTRSGNDECYSQLIFNKGNKIKDILVNNSGTWSSVDYVDISFKRPDPDAFIFSSTVKYGRARIVIEDPGEEYQKCVEIGASGDISILPNC